MEILRVRHLRLVPTLAYDSSLPGPARVR